MDGHPVPDEILLSQLKGLTHPRTRSGAVGTLLLLAPRVEPAQGPLFAPHISELVTLLAEGSGPDAPDDPSVQANAAAVLAAAAALTDELHAAVDAAAADTLAGHLRACGEASSSGGGKEGGGGGGGGSEGGAALPVNVLAAVAQLSRVEGEQPGRMLEAARSSEGLAALLALCGPAAHPAVAEGALDALCAVCCHDASRAPARAAGAVPAAARVVATSTEPGALVRALMLLGMLAASSAEARAQLVAAEEGRGAVRLFGLARQNEDADCKAISRDLLAMLTGDPNTRAGVEEAVRRAAEAAVAATAGGVPSGAAA
ncbi:MAG: hypothetical protein J3K34DRAFT_520630 [Monoraphidium minutum]|nr:MAG: hypothetical protein J3K34DRAFT_520630 [Monoraphidium minutum]